MHDPYHRLAYVAKVPDVKRFDEVLNLLGAEGWELAIASCVEKPSELKGSLYAGWWTFLRAASVGSAEDSGSVERYVRGGPQNSSR